MSNLNINHLVCAFQKEYTTIEVVFNDGAELSVEDEFLPDSEDKKYTYKCLDSMTPYTGDVFVIKAPSGILKCVTVVAVHDSPRIAFDSNIQYKWVICKVNDKAYKEVMEKEEELKEKIISLELENKKQQYINTIKETNPNLVENVQKFLE